jgi:2-dehydro-3-deoxygluconokinase
MKTKRVILLGELLLRLDTGHERFVQADNFKAYFTGAEANAGASLANWGYDVFAVSRVPDHEIGQACVNYLRRFGINTGYVQRAGERIGVFYVETGASQRKSKVIYDRSHSAFTTFSDEGIDWSEVFSGAAWLHFSGTGPAVAPALIPVYHRAIAAARQNGVTVSCDLNYRSKLWSTDRAGEVMSALMAGVDVLFCNEEDAEKVFGISAAGSNVKTGDLSREGYVSVARQLADRFPFKHVAITLRESHSATENSWSALLYSDGAASFSRKRRIHVIDRVGAGDSFVAGVVYGLCEGMTREQTIEFAAAASCLKHTIPGDFNLVSLDEVNALLAGDDSGRIQR